MPERPLSTLTQVEILGRRERLSNEERRSQIKDAEITSGKESDRLQMQARRSQLTEAEIQTRRESDRLRKQKEYLMNFTNQY